MCECQHSFMCNSYLFFISLISRFRDASSAIWSDDPWTPVEAVVANTTPGARLVLELVAIFKPLKSPAATEITGWFYYRDNIWSTWYSSPKIIITKALFIVPIQSSGGNINSHMKNKITWQSKLQHCTLFTLGGHQGKRIHKIFFIFHNVVDVYIKYKMMVHKQLVMSVCFEFKNAVFFSSIHLHSESLQKTTVWAIFSKLGCGKAKP